MKRISLFIILCLFFSCSGGAKKEGATDQAGADRAGDTAAPETPTARAGAGEPDNEGDSTKVEGEPEREIAPGVAVNTVRYIVGDIPITSYDLSVMQSELAQMKKPRDRRRRGRRGRRGRKAADEKSAVDTLIVRAILEREARRESIIISDARIEHEIQKRREIAQLGDEKKFRAEVRRQTGMPFEIWKKNLRYQLIRQQLIQIKLAVPAPDEDDVRRYYRKNRRKFGQEMRFREIILQPRNRTLDEERRISTLARQVWQEVSGQPRRFGFVARRLKENRSRRRFAGGLYDYMPVQEIAERDRLLAGALFNLRPGKVSQVFRNRRNQYYIVKLEGRRSVPFEKVENGIRRMLYVEKEQEVFNEWIEERRKQISITEVQ